MTRSIIVSFTPKKTLLPPGVTFKEYLYEARSVGPLDVLSVRSTQTEVRIDNVADARYAISISAISMDGEVIGTPALVTLAPTNDAPPGDLLYYGAPSGASVVVL